MKFVQFFVCLLYHNTPRHVIQAIHITLDWYYTLDTGRQHSAFSIHRNITRGHDDVIKWKHFPRYWPCVRGIHRSPVNSLHKGQWRGTLMFLWSAPEKMLSKQSWGWWFETPSHPLHRNGNVDIQHTSATWHVLYLRYLTPISHDPRHPLRKHPFSVYAINVIKY